MLIDVHCGVYISMYCHPVEPAMLNAQVDDDTSTVRRVVWVTV